MKQLISEGNILLLLVMTGVLSACGGTAPLQSSYLQRPIEIDGSEHDWYEYLRPIEKEPASLAVVNDDQNLYVAFLTADDQLIRRVMSTGLVVWLDPAGGKSKELGIQFPLGFMNRGRDGGIPPPDAELMRNPEARREQFEASLQYLALLRGENGESMRMSVASIPGLAVRASFESGILFYELQLPLRDVGPFSIAAGVGPGGELGIGLETGVVDAETMRRQMAERSASQMGVMNPEGGMGRGGASGQMRGGGRFIMTEPFRVWRKVTLATE